MANDLLEHTGKGPPIPYITAVWAGMSRDDIAAGVRNGSIVSAPTWFADSGDLDGAALGRGALASDLDDTAVVDRDRVDGWFRALDPEMATSTFDSIWQGSGTDDASRAQALTASLARTLLGRHPSAQDPTAAATQPEPVSIAAALDAFVADAAPHARVVDLSPMTGGDIEAAARTDVGVRYALSAMQPFALAGNRSLYAIHNADGGLDRFDPDSGETLLSDAWLGDRSKFLAWSNAQAAGADMTIDAAQNWTFVDHGATAADGGPVTLALKSRNDSGDSVANQVIFGSDEVEVLKGGSGTDRIYGGRGDDVLRGGAGTDYLEGGVGDDLVMGGAGGDELVGNQGADELDGGAGADRLLGGSGDDVLAGGGGADHLEGGIGHDVYVVDAGDGNDTIVDADGDGEIVLDGTRIEGTMQGADGGWHSADGRLEFAFTGDLEGGGDLSIRVFEAGADHGDMPANVVQVKGWKNGDLGITLADGVSSAGVETGSADASYVTAHSEAELIELATQGDAGGVYAVDSVSPQSSDAEFDFDVALSALLGTAMPLTGALDPARLQSAIAEFAGVPESPDVSAAAWSSLGQSTEGVTLAHVADALASEATGDDFDGAISAGTTTLPPEWHSTDAFVLQQEKFSGLQWSSASAKPR